MPIMIAGAAVPVAVPVVGGVLAVAAVGGILHGRAKKKALAAATKPAPPALASPKSPAPVPIPRPAGPPAAIVPASPPAIALQLPPLQVNPDGSDCEPGTPFVFDSHADAQNAVDEANRRGVSVQQVLLERAGQMPAAGPAVVTVPGQQAIVTTKDPAPAGDLILRDAPGGTQIGGAEKDGMVIVLGGGDATFTKAQWGGGSRLPAATGYARKAFLQLV